MLSDTRQKDTISEFYNDFIKYIAADWVITKGTGGTIALASAAGKTHGGWLNVPTAATLNDYQSISTQVPLFEFLATGLGPVALVPSTLKPLKARARVIVTENSANSSSWYFGLTDTLTTGLLASTGLPAASFKGAIIYKTKSAAKISFMTSNGTTQNTIANIGTFVSGVPISLGIDFNPNDGVTGLCLPSVNDQSDVSFTYFNPIPITLAGMAPMYLSAGIVASGANAETMSIDYLGCETYRF